MICNICLEKEGDVVKTCVCSHEAHLECIKFWYNDVSYGKIINKGRLCCPQCKTPGNYSRLTMSYADILNVMNKNPGWLYILCPSCKELKQYAQESCVNSFETDYRLVCSDCSPKSIKACPKCGIMIEKDGGCLHMQCSMCNVDFCWLCLKEYDSPSIYSHIDKYHTSNIESDLQYQHYLLSIEHYNMKLEDIPVEFHTVELIDLAFTYDPDALKLFEQTKQICLKAVKSNGSALQHVTISDPFDYEEICLEAVKNTGSALQFVTIYDSSRYEEICLEAVKENPSVMCYVNSKYLSNYDDICLEAVKNNYCALFHINPYRVKDYEKICLEAIKHPVAIRYVKIKTLEFNIKALEHNKDVSKYMTRYDIYDIIKHDGLLLKYIHNPCKFMCQLAIKQNGLALEYVKDQDKYICFNAINNNAHALQYVIDKTRDICVSAVVLNGLVLQYIDNQPKYVCIRAVKQNGNALKYVNDQTEEICLIAVKQNGNALKYVREQTSDICLEAVKQNKSAFKYITDTNVQEMCREYINN